MGWKDAPAVKPRWQDAPPVEQAVQQQDQRFLPSSFKELGEDIRAIPRQLGLTARYGLEAFGQTAIPDAIGLPKPQTETERVIGGASKLLVGAGGVARGAQILASAASPVAAGIGGALSANMGGQAASAVGAGIAGESVKEAGGGPWEQFFASLAGGIAAPLAIGKLQSLASGVASRLKSVTNPSNIEGAIRVEFERAGVDWNALSSDVKARLLKDAQAAIYSGDDVSLSALRRLADYRNIGATPLKGDITQDPRLVTQQRNLAKQLANQDSAPYGADLPSIENQNAKRVIEALDNVARSPDDAYAAGARLTNRVGEIDDSMRAIESGLYSSARDSAGRAIPLDRVNFVNSAMDNLVKSGKQAFLPGEIRSMLNDISRGQITSGGQTYDVPFDVDAVEALKTTLATASRSTRDGNVKAAISAVRNALENTPREAVQQSGVATQVAGQSQKAFDRARRFARGRRGWQESAEFIEDALSGAEPDKFIQKHVINGSVEEVTKLRKIVGNDAALKDSVRRQFIEHLMQRGNVSADRATFSSASLEKALQAIGDRKLSLFFTKQEISQIKSAVNVARYMQSQPIGSAVNNSNTAAMIIGRVWDALLKAGQVTPVVAPMVAGPLRSATAGVEAAQMRNVGNALTLPRPRQPLPANYLLPLAATAQGSNE